MGPGGCSWVFCPTFRAKSRTLGFWQFQMGFPLVIVNFQLFSVVFSYAQSFSVTFSHFKSLNFSQSFSFVVSVPKFYMQEFINNRKEGENRT